MQDLNRQDLWRFDDLDKALARSRQLHAPVFAYWSAEWCPPCAELQSTVLQSPDFRERSDALVTLAIDGDAPFAQSAGDRLAAEVYPTMVLLDEDAREWIRLPGGSTSEAFCEALDIACRTRMAMSELAAKAVRRRANLEEDEVALLAFHCWPQDRRIYAGAARCGLLEALDQSAMNQQAPGAARILVWRVIENAKNISAPDRALEVLGEKLHLRFVDLLRSRHASFATLYYAVTNLAPLMEFLCGPDADRRSALTAAFQNVLGDFVDDECLTWTERLIAHSARLTLSGGARREGDAGPELVERARDLVARADAASVGVLERQSAANMAGHLLRQCGLREAAIEWFRRETERSPWPTYFMPYLAEMYVDAGEQAEADRWWRRSYEETRGRNTRFELGVRYVAALTRIYPKDKATIDAFVVRLFADYGDDSDMARGRIRNSLQTLTRALTAWRAQN